jgi:hypothetical protein
MNPGPEADRRRPNPTLTQRQRELLALHAAAPPGEKLAQFCERAGIHRDTWHEWRTGNSEFAVELERIQQGRVQMALEPLRDAVPLLVDSLVRLATGGSVAALRTAGDWLGFTRRSTQNVQVAVNAHASAVPEPEKSIENLLQRRAELIEILERHAAREETKLPKAEELGDNAQGAPQGE